MPQKEGFSLFVAIKFLIAFSEKILRKFLIFFNILKSVQIFFRNLIILFFQIGSHLILYLIVFMTDPIFSISFSKTYKLLLLLTVCHSQICKGS